MAYRPEIDGLRTVAILPVVLFHAGHPAFEGGFTGVDVFFVISGYLIATSIRRDLALGRFGLMRFYEHRARRLLPAMGFMLLVSLALALAVMGPGRLLNFARAFAATGLYGSNILYWLQSGYFAPAAQLNPLLHTWSLSLEEQYYLIFPLLFPWLLGRGRRRAGAGLAILALLSFAACLVLVRTNPAFAYFMLPTRAWELLAGALCALAPYDRLDRLPRSARHAAGLLGLALIAAGMILIGKDTAFPSSWALLPVGGTVLVILFAGTGTFTARFLSLRPMVGIGLISYSIYLLHQPLLATARLAYAITPPLWLMLLLAAASLPLAWLSYRFVERPFRRRPGPLLPTRPQMLSFAGALMIAALGFGIAGEATQGWKSRFPYLQDLEAMRVVADDRRVSFPCHFRHGIDVARARDCLAAPRGEAVVLFGDSHAMRITHAFAAKMLERGLTPIVFTHPGCYPVPGTTRLPRESRENRSCSTFLEKVRPLLLDAPHPVVISTRWALNLNGDRFDNMEGGLESGGKVRVVVGSDEAPDPDRLRQQSLNEIGALAARGRVLLLSDFPEAGWDVPSLVARDLRFGIEPRSRSTSLARYETRTEKMRSLFAALKTQASNVEIVDVASLFCDRQIANRCANYIAGELYYHDDNHPSPLAAEKIAELLSERLLMPQIEEARAAR